MDIDIRNTPTFYVNIESATNRREYMEQQLTELGFCDFHRHDAVTSNPPAGSVFLNSAKILYDAYLTLTSDYILILEDDVVIKDIQKINYIISRTREKIDFDIFTASQYNPAYNIIYYPIPTDRVFISAHFVLYKRSSIPKILWRRFIKFLKYGINDHWDTTDELTVVYDGNCIYQNLYEFPSYNMTNGASMVDAKSFEIHIIETHQNETNEDAHKRIGLILNYDIHKTKHIITIHYTKFDNTIAVRLPNKTVSYTITNTVDISKIILTDWIKDYEELIENYSVVHHTL